MTTFIPGPYVVFGGAFLPLGGSGGAPSTYNGIDNDNQGPSAFLRGVATLDVRFGPYGSTNADQIIPCWAGTDHIRALSFNPSTASATNLAAAQVPVSGVAMTLAGASTGITVLSDQLYFPVGPNVFPVGTRVLDGNPGFISVGQGAGGPQPYDPQTLGSRCLQFTSVGDDHLGTVAVVGVDIYGYLVHETVTLSNATVAVSKKSLKGVVSLTPGGTLSGSNLSVGTSDTFGFPLSANIFPDVLMFWNNALITATTGVTTRAVGTATATTGDVRGTYAVQSASDGTKALVVFANPRQTLVGLVGAVQF